MPVPLHNPVRGAERSVDLNGDRCSGTVTPCVLVALYWRWAVESPKERSQATVAGFCPGRRHVSRCAHVYTSTIDASTTQHQVPHRRRQGFRQPSWNSRSTSHHVQIGLTTKLVREFNRAGQFAQIICTASPLKIHNLDLRCFCQI